jgi:hypothetical protein
MLLAASFNKFFLSNSLSLTNFEISHFEKKKNGMKIELSQKKRKTTIQLILLFINITVGLFSLTVFLFTLF